LINVNDVAFDLSNHIEMLVSVSIGLGCDPTKQKNDWYKISCGIDRINELYRKESKN
jgi:hypothetical protein